MLVIEQHTKDAAPPGEESRTASCTQPKTAQPSQRLRTRARHSRPQLHQLHCTLQPPSQCEVHEKTLTSSTQKQRTAPPNSSTQRRLTELSSTLRFRMKGAITLWAGSIPSCTRATPFRVSECDTRAPNTIAGRMRIIAVSCKPSRIRLESSQLVSASTPPSSSTSIPTEAASSSCRLSASSIFLLALGSSNCSSSRLLARASHRPAAKLARTQASDTASRQPPISANRRYPAAVTLQTSRSTAEVSNDWAEEKKEAGRLAITDKVRAMAIEEPGEVLVGPVQRGRLLQKGKGETPRRQLHAKGRGLCVIKFKSSEHDIVRLRCKRTRCLQNCQRINAPFPRPAKR